MDSGRVRANYRLVGPVQGNVPRRGRVRATGLPLVRAPETGLPLAQVPETDLPIGRAQANGRREDAAEMRLPILDRGERATCNRCVDTQALVGEDFAEQLAEDFAERLAEDSAGVAGDSAAVAVASGVVVEDGVPISLSSTISSCSVVCRTVLVTIASSITVAIVPTLA